MLLVALISLIGLVLFVNVCIAEEDATSISNSVGILVGYSIYLLYSAIITTIVLSVLIIVKNPENLKKTLLGLGTLAILLIISYVLGDSDAVVDAQGIVIEGGEGELLETSGLEV